MSIYFSRPQDLSGYVPYTGATADVDIGSQRYFGRGYLAIDDAVPAFSAYDSTYTWGFDFYATPTNGVFAGTGGLIFQTATNPIVEFSSSVAGQENGIQFESNGWDGQLIFKYDNPLGRRRFDFSHDVDITGDILASGTGTFGGGGAGQSAIQSGLVVNEAGGATGDDDFRAETNTNASALVVDASAEEVKIGAELVYTPSATQSITATSDAISANATMIVLNPSSNLTLVSTPTIANGTTGQILYITCGNAEVNTVTLQDQDTLASSNLQLGGATRSIKGRDVLQLLFDGTNWLEVSYSQNSN